METRETLEAALAAQWDRDTLAVYADHLQAEGDPRGELIALDLQIEAHGNNMELSKRRTSLLYAWLGALVPVDNVHASWAGDSLQFGFVDDLVFDSREANALARLEQLLASPAGPYVRGLTMRGDASALEEALTVVARREHVWLARFTIGAVYQPTTIAANVASEAFRAMPRLETLELRSQPVFAPFSHPSIKRLVIQSRDVYVALGEGASFEDVAELDVVVAQAMAYDEYDGEYVEEPPEAAAAALPKVSFPSLRRLDLAHHGIANIDAAYELLRTIDARAHVTHVKIPQLRNGADREDLIAAIRDMPALEAIEVAHGSYYDPPDLPNVRFVRAETWPWPTQELAQGRGLRIYMPLAKYGDTVTLVDAVYVMETSYETLPPPARAAWSQLWQFVAALDKEPGTFSARLLAEAVDAFPSLMQNGWRELREELSARRPLAADAMVKIERSKI
ncbi:MAG: hypothetical protein M4D80_36350 [Myxococcota bacterium]|nr:hypothetical protein [Myxococcota bacterium]